MEFSNFQELYFAKEMYGEDIYFEEGELLIDTTIHPEESQSVEVEEQIESPHQIESINVRENIPPVEDIAVQPARSESESIPIPVRHVQKSREGIRDEFVEYYKKVVAENSCPLYRRGRKFIFGAGNLNELDAMILYSKVSETDEEDPKRPMLSPAGKFVLSKLKDAGLNLKNSFISPIIKCRPQQNELTNAVRAANIDIMLRQIEIAKPPIIIIFGLELALYLIKSESGKLARIAHTEFVHDLRHRVITMKNGYRAVVTYDYEEIATNKVKHDEFMSKDLPFIAEVYKNLK